MRTYWRDSHCWNKNKLSLVDMDEFIKTPEELEQALKDYQENDNVDVLQSIAWYYDDVKQDTKTARLYYRLNVERQGKYYQVSTYNLAHILRQCGDKDEALALLQQIEAEDMDAVLLMAQIYAYRDKEKCLEYFDRVIDAAEPHVRSKALLSLANYYRMSYSKLGQDAMKSFTLTERAVAELDSQVKDNEAVSAVWAKACMQLADLYHKGFGTPVDMHKSTATLLKVPVEQLDITSKYNLATWYYRGKGCIRRDVAKALDLFFALDQESGDADAQYMIGDSFEHGQNPEHTKNLTLAKQWYQKSADNGQVGAIKRLMGMVETAEERAQLLEKLLEHRRRYPRSFESEFPNNHKTITVDYDVLDLLTRELVETRRQVEEYQLRPPLIGGELYRKTAQLYQKHAAENDVK